MTRLHSTATDRWRTAKRFHSIPNRTQKRTYASMETRHLLTIPTRRQLDKLRKRSACSPPDIARTVTACAHGPTSLSADARHQLMLPADAHGPLPASLEAPCHDSGEGTHSAHASLGMLGVDYLGCLTQPEGSSLGAKRPFRPTQPARHHRQAAS